MVYYFSLMLLLLVWVSLLGRLFGNCSVKWLFLCSIWVLSVGKIGVG